MKVSEMPLTEEVKDDDLLMIVQDGSSKKIPAKTFQQTSGTAPNAEKLNGYTDDDFVKKDEPASDTEKVGGTPAEDMATKGYVDAKIENARDWSWCCPQLWFDATKLPYEDTEHFAFCDGRALDKDLYPDLFAIIGYSYSEVKTGQQFQIPNLMGRFPLGSYTYGNQAPQTWNLPNGVYNGIKGFSTDGQWIYPSKAGERGGDPTTTQESVWQMATHSHTIQESKPINSSYVQNVNNNGSGAYAFNDNKGGVTRTDIEGMNNEIAIYPPNEGNPRNYGMISMPPYLTFAYVMQIKKFN